MLSSLSSWRGTGPFPLQHFWITDLVQISGIESQRPGYKILAPRGLFGVVGSFHNSYRRGSDTEVGVAATTKISSKRIP